MQKKKSLQLKLVITLVNRRESMKDKFTFKVTYSDGSVEFWYNTVSQTIAEMSRLQKIHDNKIEIEFIE